MRLPASQCGSLVVDFAVELSGTGGWGRMMRQGVECRTNPGQSAEEVGLTF